MASVVLPCCCTRNLWRNYSLSIVLGLLFLTSFLVHGWTGWHRFSVEQQQHGEVARWLGDDGYVWEWAVTTLENWQSEFLQLLTFVILTSFLIHKGSHESKDSDEQMQAQLDRMEEQLQDLGERLEGSVRHRSGWRS